MYVSCVVSELLLKCQKMLFNYNRVLLLKNKIFIRNFSVKRKYPVNIEEANNLPIFEYPVSSNSDKRVYAWGLTETGALGVKEPKTSRKKISNFITHPTRISFAERQKVEDIACGYGFTLYAVKSKEFKLFGTGINTDSQIGYHTQRKGGVMEYLSYPSPISLPLLKPETTKVIQVSAGRAHTVLLTDQEGAFTMGNNSYGQCGRPIDEHELYANSKAMPYSIPKLNGQDIIFIHCGQDHSLFINTSGKVFSCGWGADGQTGLGHYNNESNPTQVLGDISLETIIKVGGTVDCVLAINDKGEVFGWGNSEYRQLSGEDSVQQVSTPRHLAFCKKFGKIVDIAAGGACCSMVNENGDVFVWGYGILGKGPEVEHSHEPTQLPSVLFGKNDYNPNIKVESLDCGLSNFAAVTNQGDLYTWGRNKHSCLGLGHSDNQYFPYKVSVGAQVLKVSCGVDHTVALCKPFI